MFKASFCKYILEFIKPARTSRNELHTHEVYYLQLQRLKDGKVTYGEAAPLKGLSIDDVPDFAARMKAFCSAVNEGTSPEALDFSGYPSIGFAFETAMLCMRHDALFQVSDNPFFRGEPITINGLVWMADSQTMLTEALNKAEKGFNTIKFKIGALDFDEECRMLEQFRKHFSAHRVDVRLDANGAFKHTEALEQLRELHRFDIHSIEQPIKAGQPEMMGEVCAKSPIVIALDEELIGVDVYRDGFSLLKHITPGYIILKPTLTGGLKQSDEWIRHAGRLDIGWWATSALESNIGLNAIAQWAATHHNTLPQGLGTGALYRNNISSPLSVSSGKLVYDQSGWDLHPLHQLFDQPPIT